MPIEGVDNDYDDTKYPERQLTVDFEWRLVCMVDRILEEQPELRAPLERALGLRDG